jgi:fibronectin-binding autotransporter adhesin
MQADAGGYVGAAYAAAQGVAAGSSTDANYDFIEAFNKAATLGTIGIDGGNTFSGNLDLTGFGATARLGSSTTGTIPSGTAITPQGSDYRFGGGGGILYVGSVLSNGASIRGLNMGTSGSLAPGTVVLSGANTYTGNTVIAAGTLRVTHATAGLAACKVQIAGGAFTGPASAGTGVVTFNLGATPDSGIVMTSGSLDISRLGLIFAGTATRRKYTLVDYSAGGTLTTATGVRATKNTFASAANVPAGYVFVHDTAVKKIFLQPPAGTTVQIR